MHIESIKIKNFKMFKSLEINNIPKMVVFIGANGTGKTTLFDMFGFLHDCLLHDVHKALSNRGGFKEVISRGTPENESIDFEIKFRAGNKISKDNPLITYQLEIIEENNVGMVKKEVYRHRRGLSTGEPYKFLEFQFGKGFAISEESIKNYKEVKPENRLEYTLDSPSILAIKALSHISNFETAKNFRKLLESWHVSDIKIDIARGVKEQNGYNEHLSKDGNNLQMTLKYIHDYHKANFNKIIESMKKRIPGIDNIEINVTRDNRLVCEIKEKNFEKTFLDNQVSDGTIKMLAYLALLYDPKPHPLLCIEEPENQLYPELMTILAEEFRQYAQNGGQLFVSTHSPDFLNGCNVDEVFWLEKVNGFSNIHRAKDNAQVAEFMRQGDKMGYLWKQGLFKGVSPL